MVLVCFAIAAAVFLGVVRLAAASRSRADVELWQAQAGWLAESAIDQAAARLAADAKYSGETWRPTAAELGLPYAAAVAIRLEPGEDRRHWRVHIEADYPDDPAHRARRKRDALIAQP